MSKFPNGFEPHECFNYENNEIQFVADVADIRAVNVFCDDNTNQWCAGVGVREAYQRIRFANQDEAREFADAVAQAKSEYNVREARNKAAVAAQRDIKRAGVSESGI